MKYTLNQNANGPLLTTDILHMEVARKVQTNYLETPCQVISGHQKLVMRLAQKSLQRPAKDSWLE
jgi:hypothetical protein